MVKTRHVVLLQSAEAANKKRSVLIDNLSELVNDERLDFGKIDRTLKNIEILSKASSILKKEANEPYKSWMNVEL